MGSHSCRIPTRLGTSHKKRGNASTASHEHLGPMSAAEAEPPSEIWGMVEFMSTVFRSDLFKNNTCLTSAPCLKHHGVLDGLVVIGTVRARAFEADLESRFVAHRRGQRPAKAAFPARLGHGDAVTDLGVEPMPGHELRLGCKPHGRRRPEVAPAARGLANRGHKRQRQPAWSGSTRQIRRSHSLRSVKSFENRRRSRTVNPLIQAPYVSCLA